MKTILFAIVTVLPIVLFAQQNQNVVQENMLLKARIDSLERKLDEKYYTRIPNKDLDDKLSDMINDEVSNYISGRIALASTVIGVISFLLGFLAKYFLSESTRKQIEENVKKLSDKVNKDNEDAQKKMEALLSDHKEFISTNNHLNDDRIKDMNLRFENLRSVIDNQFKQFAINNNKNISDFQSNTNARLKQVDEQLSKVTETIQASLKTLQLAQDNFEKASNEKIEVKFTDTFDFLWSDIISGMIDRAAQKNYNGLSLVNDFEKLLNKDLKISIDLKIEIIDTLMRCYYYTSQLEEKRYIKMVELIRNYEDKYDLLPATYVNAAIALTNNYELYGTPDLRESALTNCDKSIQKNRDYGVPYAIKIEILAIAFTKSKEEVRKKCKQDIEELLFLIDHIPSPLLKGKFLERLLIDKDVPYLKDYIELLYKDYAKELAPYRENVVQKLVENYAETNEDEKKLFANLLQEGMALHPDMNGRWKAVSFKNAGHAVDIVASEIFIEIVSSQYIFSTSAGYKETGVIYFLPHLIPYACCLIAEEGGNKLKPVRGIYMYEKDTNKLTLCLSVPDGERPTAFDSTPQNGCSLIVFSLVTE